MNKSPEVKELAKALAGFQAEVANVPKNGVNPFFKSKYATLENVIDTIRPTLKKNGLSFAQFPDGDGLTTILMHTSGEWLEASSAMTVRDATPQGQGSAITYLRRYALSAVLGIATEEDDDGNAAAKPAERAQPAARTTQRAQPPKPTKDEATARLEAFKERIVTLLKLLDKPTKTKKQCEDAVFDLVGMALTAENYEAIGEALAERLEAKNA
jgi:ERF superfamily